MQLRPRQQLFVDRCHEALKKHGNSIGIAPTGAGKTVMLSALASRFKTSLVLQHRTEILQQNLGKFKRVAPEARTATFAANVKRWAEDGHTFAMMQTLQCNLDRMKPVGVLVVDEAHRSASDGYLKIIDRQKELNPDVLVFGVTATPERGDGKGLRAVFDNVGDQITLGELIHAGHLVRPQTFVIDLGLDAAIAEHREDARKRRLSDFDPGAADQLFNVSPITDQVISEWKRLAADRRTVIFTASVSHSENVAAAFREAGITAEHIDGTTNAGERKAILRRLDTGKTQVVCNCAVLTEGWDSPSVSCVVLLRPLMHRSTMLQMIGRGLRTISEPENYPGIIKDSAVILDCGSSLLHHGSIEADYSIDAKHHKPGEAPKKMCQECDTEVPASSKNCPFCGHEFLIKGRERDENGSFVLTEIELLDLSPYAWEKPFPGADITIANALAAEGILIAVGGVYFAYGKIQGQPAVKLLSRTRCKLTALAAADDFLRLHGDASAAKKSKRWINEPASDKQREMLGLGYFDQVSRYRASCMLSWKFNEGRIKASVMALS